MSSLNLKLFVRSHTQVRTEHTYNCQCPLIRRVERNIEDFRMCLLMFIVIIDIVEHEYALVEYTTKLSPGVDIKDPAQSKGLTQAEADTRLARDGKNVLTPPKKKSALRKVSNCCIPIISESIQSDFLRSILTA